MKLLFTRTAKEAYDRYKLDAPELAIRIKEVLIDILDHPSSGLGMPVALDGPFSGLWQRCFVADKVLIYSFDEESVTVCSIGDQVSALKAVQLNAYSKEEEDAVMAQMAANRGKDNEPKVGIFWYNRATNMLFGVVSHRVSDYTKANASEGRITCSEMHEDVWKKESSMSQLPWMLRPKMKTVMSIQYGCRGVRVTM